LKRGTIEERRWLCFRCWDTDHDGVVERADFKRVVDAKAILYRQSSQGDDEVSSFFALVDDRLGNQFEFDAFETYCSVYGDGVVNSTLKIFEVMFDQCIDETGISITSTDVKNSKPHIDWQDHKIKMSGLLCCSSLSPMFTKAPAIAWWCTLVSPTKERRISGSKRERTKMRKNYNHSSLSAIPLKKARREDARAARWDWGYHGSYSPARRDAIIRAVMQRTDFALLCFLRVGALRKWPAAKTNKQTNKHNFLSPYIYNIA